MKLICGNALDALGEMDSESVHCIITSPPYYRLRDYGANAFGMEKTPKAYISKLVRIFREARRVLRKDGTMWLNIGDSYAGSWGAQSKEKTNYRPHSPRIGTRAGSIPKGTRLKPKDLMGIPWQLAAALRDDGWFLRQDLIWHKPNPVPTKIMDRFQSSHEYIFLFSRSRRGYFFDPSGPPGSVLRVPVAASSGHGSTFPIEIPKFCIHHGCAPGGIVLDPFCGIATTGLAAIGSGRRFIGVDINRAYLEAAANRARQIYPLLSQDMEVL